MNASVSGRASGEPKRSAERDCGAQDCEIARRAFDGSRQAFYLFAFFTNKTDLTKNPLMMIAVASGDAHSGT